MKTVRLACVAGLLLNAAASPATAGKGIIKATSTSPPNSTSVSTAAQPCADGVDSGAPPAGSVTKSKSATDSWGAQTRCARPQQGGAQSGAPASTIGIPSMDASSKDTSK